MDRFNKLIEDQFTYGGEKYAKDNEREATDDLFDAHSKSWLFGTMDKYTYRYKNKERERDLLKIATYCYILWLKRGFWVKKTGLNDVLDTTVLVKKQQFSLFIEKLNDYLDSISKGFNNNDKDTILSRLENRPDKINKISERFKNWSRASWKDCDEVSIFVVYYQTFLIWLDKYANVEQHDTDTYNEIATR